MRLVFGLVLMLGLTLAGAAVWMVQGYVSQAQNDVAREQAERLRLGPLVEIYVVNKPMAYGSAVTKDDVQKVLFPMKSLPENTFSDEAQLFPASGKPRYIRRQMEKFEPLLSAKVTEPGEDAGLTTRLSKGKRAFAIKVDVASGVSGFVQPGDNVDIYWTGSATGTEGNITQLIESSMRVVAVDQMANDERSTSALVARTVTVEATPQQVARLAQAQATGRLALSLVGANDETVVQDVEINSAALLGIEAAAPVEQKVEKVCSVKAIKGNEVIETPIPCLN